MDSNKTRRPATPSTDHAQPGADPKVSHASVDILKHYPISSVGPDSSVSLNVSPDSPPVTPHLAAGLTLTELLAGLHRLAKHLHPEDLRSALMLFEEELQGRVLDCRRFNEHDRRLFYDAAARAVALARLNLERAGRGTALAAPKPCSHGWHPRDCAVCLAHKGGQHAGVPA